MEADAGRCDVLKDRAREQDGLLRDQPHLGPERRDVERPRVDAVDDHGAARDLVEAQQQLHDGRLAAARGAHERARRPRRDVEAEPGADGPVRPRGVAELDVDELDGPGAPRRRDGRSLGSGFGVRGVGDGRGVGLVDDFEDARGLGPGELVGGDAREGLEQRQTAEQHAEEGRHHVAARDALVVRLAEVAGRVAAVVAVVVALHVLADQVAAVPQAEGPGAVEDARDERRVRARRHGGAERRVRRARARRRVAVHLPALAAERRHGPHVDERLVRDGRRGRGRVGGLGVRPARDL